MNKELTVEQAREMKMKLEDDLKKLLTDFSNQTGFTVEFVNINSSKVAGPERVLYNAYKITVDAKV